MTGSNNVQIYDLELHHIGNERTVSITRTDNKNLERKTESPTSRFLLSGLPKGRLEFSVAKLFATTKKNLALSLEGRSACSSSSNSSSNTSSSNSSSTAQHGPSFERQQRTAELVPAPSFFPRCEFDFVNVNTLDENGCGERGER